MQVCNEYLNKVDDEARNKDEKAERKNHNNGGHYLLYTQNDCIEKDNSGRTRT